MKDTLTLNAGTSSAIEFPFTANPQPKVTWTYNDGSLPDAKRFKTQTITCMTSMTMAKVVLKDAGDYKVTLENENGQASFTTKLIVLGKWKATVKQRGLVNFTAS
jgi:Immunoglobulin I-set domain